MTKERDKSSKVAKHYKLESYPDDTLSNQLPLLTVCVLIILATVYLFIAK